MLKVLQGDAATMLPTLAPDSAHTCVTSPPYWGLRDYGLDPLVWDGDRECNHQWGDEVRVNATNHTDKRRWNHTRNGRDELQPVEKRVAWLRTEVGQGRWCQKCGAWAGSLGLEPYPELYVLHLVSLLRLVRKALRSDATLWLNIGDSYYGAGQRGTQFGSEAPQPKWREKANAERGHKRGTPHPQHGLKFKDLVGVPWMVAFALRADGWFLRSDIVWSKRNPMPESVTDRPTKSHEYIFLLSKSERYYYDQDSIREPHETGDRKGDRRSYKPGSASSMNDGEHQSMTGSFAGLPLNPLGRNKRTVWSVNTKPFPDAHFATFPPELIRPCILAGAPIDGVVLDPFAGSGTTGKVAIELGRKAILIEPKAEYVEMIKRRCQTTIGLPLAI